MYTSFPAYFRHPYCTSSIVRGFPLHFNVFGHSRWSQSCRWNVWIASKKPVWLSLKGHCTSQKHLFSWLTRCAFHPQKDHLAEYLVATACISSLEQLRLLMSTGSDRTFIRCHSNVKIKTILWASHWLGGARRKGLPNAYASPLCLRFCSLHAKKRRHKNVETRVARTCIRCSV